MDGTRAYVAARHAGVVVLDITDPSSPSTLGSFVPTSAGGGSLSIDAVAVDGTTVYAGGGDGSDGSVAALDVSDPASISQLGVSDAISGEAASSLGFASGYVFYGGTNGTLIVFDSDLAQVATYTNAGSAGHEPWGLGITIVEDQLSCSDRGAVLIALDITDPTNPTEVGVLATGDGVYDSAIAQGLTIDGTTYDTVAVVANSQGGMVLANVADDGLSEIGTYDVVPPGEMADGPHGVALDGARKLAVLADNMAQTITLVRIAD